MKTKHSDLVEKLTVRVNAEVVSAIQKSGQSAPDWLRQAARNRIDGERQAETPTGKLEKQVAALQQRIDDLKKDGIDTRKEIARLQQSETIVQAALLDMRKNHVELRRSLEQMNASFGHAFTTLGQSLLVALSQQLDQHLQKLTAKAEEGPPVKIWPPAPPRTRL
jgi:predicted  nucleic acid-binding Zn-ribbon protein